MDDIVDDARHRNDDDENNINDKEETKGGGDNDNEDNEDYTMTAARADRVANDGEMDDDVDYIEGVRPTTTTTTATERRSSQLQDRDGIMLICGAKGVGKSTFLRYAANRLLSGPTKRGSDGNRHRSSRRRSVAILDLDCGQPELGVPGTMSLTLVSRPLMMDPPGHTVWGGSVGRMPPPSKIDDDYSEREGWDSDDATMDHRRHEASYFFGDITSKSDPDSYVDMSSRLMQRYHDLRSSLDLEEHPIPLIVNTDGWVKGLGYEVLSAIVGVVDPGHIVQIVGNTKAKSFDMSAHREDGCDVNGGTVGTNNDHISRRRRSSRRMHVVESFDGSSLNDDVNDRPASARVLLATASDHRSHRLCAYFLGGYDAMSNLRPLIFGEDEAVSFHRERGLHDPNNVIGMTIASMMPYAVPFQSVRVYPSPGFMDCATNPGAIWGVRGDSARYDVLDSLNGTIVGLCRDPNVRHHADRHSVCDARTGVPILDCVGLGIIRSIDRPRGLFFVLTPVHPTLLSGVTSFVGGNIHLPLECVHRGVHSDSFPYISCGHAPASAISGSDAMRNR
jgi:polynucleotide 5'-hydroxyl-kinase GRC3/NOL9